MPPPKPPPLPLVLILMTSLLVSVTSSPNPADDFDYTHHDPNNFGPPTAYYDEDTVDTVDAPLQVDGDSDYGDSDYGDSVGGKGRAAGEPEMPEEKDVAEEKFWIPYDEFFEKYWPPKKGDGSLLSQEEWNELYKKRVAEWELHQKLKATRPVPVCVVGEFDPHAVGFIEAGVFNQPEPNDTHKVLKAGKDGAVPGVLEAIEFFSIHSPSPDAKDKIPGIGRLNQWLHIVVKTEKPVEGFFIQAIMGPLGVPFGEFRDDFECTNELSDVASVKHKDNHIVSCRYRAMTAERHPNVFFTHSCGDAPSGTITDKCPNPRQVFRVHFNWNEFQCNFVSRMQFLIVVVESFHLKKFTHVLSTSYEHTIDSLDGVAYPFYSGWEGSMTCDEKVDVLTDKWEQKKLTFHSVRSKFDILNHYAFDECIQGLLPKDWKADPHTCPPGPLRCSPPPSKGALTLEELRKLNEEMSRRTSFEKPCAVPQFCHHPRNTELRPKPKPRDNGTGAEKVLDTGGVGPDNAFVRQVLKVKVHAQTSHGHLMLLACFVLFGVGAFPARFLKESLGLDPSGEKAVVSIGRWVWLHLLSFLLALAVLWVGVSHVLHFHDEPRVPCLRYTRNGLLQLQKAFLQNERKMDDVTAKVIADLLGASNGSHVEGRAGKEGERAEDSKNRETPLSVACGKTEAAIWSHAVVGLLATLSFHAAFFGGIFRPPSTRCAGSLHFALGYLAHLLSFGSLLPLVYSGSMCKLVILLGGVLFVIPYVFVGGGWVVQRLEDKSRGVKGRRVVPLNEGISVPGGKSRWGLGKATLWVGSSAGLVGVYLAVFFVYIHVYDQQSAQPHSVGMDALNCPLFECSAPSWRIDAYVLSDEL